MLEITSSKLARSGSTRSSRATSHASPHNRKSGEVRGDSSQSWTEKYHPKSISDLPVHVSKVRAVRDWLEKALEMHSCYFDLGAAGAPPCFLAICGNSGCCKTSTIQLVAEEEGVDVVVWSEDMWEPSAMSTGGSDRWSSSGERRPAQDSTYESLFGTSYSSTARDLFRVDGVTTGAWTSKNAVLESFALQSSYPSLSLQTKPSTSNSRSSTPMQAAGESKSSQSNLALQGSSEAGFGFQRKVILLRDPPGYDSSSGGYSGANSERLQSMYNFILSFQCPVVMVLSDVSGRDDLQYVTDRCLPRHVRQRVQFESIYFPPITENKVAKVLNTILRAEGLLVSGGKGRGKSAAGAGTGGKTGHYDALVQDIAASCLGDVRHAVLQLQLSVSVTTPASAGRAITGRGGSEAMVSLKRAQSVPVTSSSGASALASNNRPRSGPELAGQLTVPRVQSDADIDLTGDDSGAEFVRHGGSETGAGASRGRRRGTRPGADDVNRTVGNVDLVDTETESDSPVGRQSAPRGSGRHRAGVVRDSSSDDSDAERGGDLTRDAHLANSVDGEGYAARGLGTKSRKAATVSQAKRGSSDSALGSSDYHPVVIPAVISDPPAVATGKGVGRRDSSFSSLRSVGKLLGAKLDAEGRSAFDLDSVIERSELSPELILAFMQWNLIASVQATPRDLSSLTAAGVAGDTAAVEMKEIQTALDSLSEVDLYLSRKYDSQGQADRSGTGCYPDGYISAILGRSMAVSRGPGSAEAHERAKSRGFRSTFQGIFRPKALNLRTQRAAVHSKLSTLQEELLDHLSLGSTPSSAAAGPESDPIAELPGEERGAGGLHRPVGGTLRNGAASAAPTRSTTRPGLGSVPAPQPSSISSSVDSGVGRDSPHVSVASVPSHRDLVLTVVPYFKAIAHAAFAAPPPPPPSQPSHTSAGPATGTQSGQRAPVYSERLDWLMTHLYDQHFTAPLPPPSQFRSTTASNSIASGGGQSAAAAAQAEEVGAETEFDEAIDEFD